MEELLDPWSPTWDKICGVMGAVCLMVATVGFVVMLPVGLFMLARSLT